MVMTGSGAIAAADPYCIVQGSTPPNMPLRNRSPIRVALRRQRRDRGCALARHAYAIRVLQVPEHRGHEIGAHETAPTASITCWRQNACDAHQLTRLESPAELSPATAAAPAPRRHRS